MQCKIRITKGLEGVWMQYQPEVGKVYDAEYVFGTGKHRDIAIIVVNDKRIIVRKHEFELVEE